MRRKKVRNILIRPSLNMSSSTGTNDRLSRFSSSTRSSSRKTVARGTMGIGVSRRALAVMVSHGL